MVCILKGKVSSLPLMAIIWTASSNVAQQACGEATAASRWGNAQAAAAASVTQSRDASRRYCFILEPEERRFGDNE